MPTICLCMIVKNEARIIERCLNSVAAHIDSWVICDTGSTDGTQQLIRDTLAQVPGELVEVPWVNFGHNRSQAIELASGKADYLLIMDADLILSVHAPFKDKLTEDAYDLRYEGALDYVNTRLVSTKHTWKYVGVTHEYITSPTCRTFAALPEVSLIDFGDGGSKSDKFERDIRLLTDSLFANPNNPRDTFYLAQSYRDLGRYGEAVYWYEKRMGMPHGWDEENWYAMFQFARMQQKIGIQWTQVQTSYANAFCYRPTRLEPIYEIAKHYREMGQASMAMLFASNWRANPNHYPADRLFIDRPVYKHLLPFEYFLSATALGRWEEAQLARQLLLAQPGRPAYISQAIGISA